MLSRSQPPSRFAHAITRHLNRLQRDRAASRRRISGPTRGRVPTRTASRRARSAISVGNWDRPQGSGRFRDRGHEPTDIGAGGDGEISFGTDAHASSGLGLHVNRPQPRSRSVFVTCDVEHRSGVDRCRRANIPILFGQSLGRSTDGRDAPKIRGDRLVRIMHVIDPLAVDGPRREVVVLSDSSGDDHAGVVATALADQDGVSVLIRPEVNGSPIIGRPSHVDCVIFQKRARGATRERHGSQAPARRVPADPNIAPIGERTQPGDSGGFVRHHGRG